MEREVAAERSLLLLWRGERDGGLQVSNTRIQQQSRGRGVKQKKQDSTKKCWQLIV